MYIMFFASYVCWCQTLIIDITQNVVDGTKMLEMYLGVKP